MASTIQYSNASKRDSNMELLRLVLMFLIVIHHGIIHGLKLLQPSDFHLQEQVILPGCIVESFCLIAVNTFILISGYFSIRVNKSKLVSLFCQVFVATILFSTSFFLIKGDISNSIQSIFVISHSRYWFIIDYLILMAIAPAINLFFESFSRSTQSLFVLALVFVSCYLGFLWHFEANVTGFSVFQFITMYSVGRYLCKNNIQLKSIPAIIIYTLCSISLSIIMLVFHKTGHDSWACIMTYYNNPVLIVSSIAIFFIFKNMKIQNYRINHISTSSLFIYLFTSSALVEYYYYSFVQTTYFAHREVILLIITACALLLSVIAVLIDKLFFSRLVVLLHKVIMSIKLPKVSLS